jgi:hypothetical protein
MNSGLMANRGKLAITLMAVGMLFPTACPPDRPRLLSERAAVDLPAPAAPQEAKAIPGTGILTVRLTDLI